MTNPELTPMDIRSKVYKVISEHLGISQDRIKDDSDLVNDLGADSLDIIEIVMGIEEEFDIEVTEDEANASSTISSVIDLVTVKTVGSVNSLSA